MTIVPTGNAPWLRTAGFEQYGGHAEKKNHLSFGVIDAQTDVGASQFARMTADLAAVTRVVPFGFFVAQCNDTSPAAPTILLAHMQTGISSASYEGDAAPSGFPSAARTADGAFTITFASSYNDDYGMSGAISIKPGFGDSRGSNGGIVNFTATSSTVVTVEAYENDGTTRDADALIAFSVFTA